MSSLPTYDQTLALVRVAHRGQVDKQGHDYVDHHLVPVADRLAEHGEEARIAGLLHDVLEDTSVTAADLSALGYSEDVVAAVVSVTNVDGVPYDETIARAAAHPLGRKVKLADNALNLGNNPDLARTDPEKAARLKVKYEKAREVLLAAERAGARGVFEECLGTWGGTSAFRMYPHDEFADGPSALQVEPVAGGVGRTLAFTWVHPTEGEQHGHLLVGTPEDGALTVAYLDSWHQKAGLAVLTGTGEGAAFDVSYEYAPGWRWRIVVGRVEDGLTMRMTNTVPEGVEGAPAGEYDVVRAHWRRAD